MRHVCALGEHEKPSALTSLPPSKLARVSSLGVAPMLLPLRPSTTLFINNPSKLACYAPGMEADWSPTARIILTRPPWLILLHPPSHRLPCNRFPRDALYPSEHRL